MRVPNSTRTLRESLTFIAYLTVASTALIASARLFYTDESNIVSDILVLSGIALLPVGVLFMQLECALKEIRRLVR